MPAISRLYIYAEPRSAALDIDELARYARRHLPETDVVRRGPLLEESIDGSGPLETQVDLQELAQRLACSRIKRFEAPLDPDQEALYGEVAYEARRLCNRESDVFGVLYEGYAFASILRDLLPAEESRLEDLHVVFTGQLIGSWDSGDLRYHARSVLLGAPSIVSLSGMVEAPAKARGYYVARRSAEAMGMGEEEKMELARSFAEDCLSHDDPRLTEAAKGYLMQAVAYRMTGEAFCEDEGCRLFNAHWQKELLGAQFGGDQEFCRAHGELFDHCLRQGW